MIWLKFVVVVCLVVAVLGLAIYKLYRRTTRDLPKPAYRRPNHTPEIHEWDDESLNISWIGHSTMLMKLNGLVIITDPVFSERVGVHIPFLTVGPKRHVAPAIDVDDCPRINVVMLSHAHMDHVDFPSLRRLVGPDTVIVVPQGTRRLFRRLGARQIVEVGAGETVDLAVGLRVVGQKVRHWGNRFPWNKNYGYLGYVIMRGPYRVFFAGDTAYTDDVAQVANYRPHVACMPIGAYSPEQFQTAHCTPEQAWRMFLSTGAPYLIPMHHDTFVLSQEPIEEPMNRLLACAGRRRDAIVLQHQGQTFQLRL